MTLILSAGLVLILVLSIAASSLLPTEKQNDITRIIYRTNIHCVSELPDKAMFTSPPSQKLQDSDNLLETGLWENNDWETKDSSNIISNVADKRWEDFSFNKTNYIRFVEAISVSFSVYGTEEIEFFADDGESLDYFKHPIEEKEEWTTFTIFFKDDHVNYYMNNNYVRKHELKPTQLVAKTTEDAYFKVHNYNYKEATSVTNAENSPTSLTIPPSEKSFLVLYISLCTSCILDIEFAGYKKSIDSNIKETDTFEQWRTHKIELNSSVMNRVNFIRRKTDEKDGYWKLDVRLHNNKNNAVAYDIDRFDDKPEDLYYCKYFQPPNSLTQNRRKRMVSPEHFSGTTDCPLGMVGPNCDISCESVLGHEYPQCQQHMICDSMKCQCAWGYYGRKCSDECAHGWWGLNCQQQCEDCQECNKQTGKCTNSGGIVKNWFFWTTIVLFSILLIVGIVEGWRCRINRNPLSSRLDLTLSDEEKGGISGSNTTYNTISTEEESLVSPTNVTIIHQPSGTCTMDETSSGTTRQTA